jgi:hypothetical protein
MAMGELERVVAVDWSGDKGPGQRKKLWAGVWTAATGRVTLEGGRSREELIEWVIGMSRDTPRLVMGIDCCFSYPAWFLREHGCATVFEFWQKVAEGKGEEWLHRECEDARFWGVRGPGRSGKRPEEFCGPNLRRMLRETDWENKIAQGLEGGDPERAAKMMGIQAKSPFQIGGSGSVGTGSLRAMPYLLRLRGAGFRVWPYDDAALGVRPRPLLVEMYTRLLTGAVKKSNPVARKKYLAARKKTAGREYGGLFARLSRDVLEKALGSEDAFDALVCCVEMVRWQKEFIGLKRTQDGVLKVEGITWRPGVIG